MATVSISAVVGDNGIIAKAKLAKNIQANSIQAEQDAMDELFQEYANAMAGEGSVGETPDEPQEPENPTVAVESVSLDKTNETLALNETLQLTATIAPSDATNKNVTWSSSTPSVATVSKTGLVTALAQGSTNITVTTEDGGKTASCSVTVTPPEITDETEAGQVVKTPEEWTTLVGESISDGNGTAIPLPSGFYYVGGDYDTGLVISDKQGDTIDASGVESGNQFVWIPVESEAAFVRESFGDDWNTSDYTEPYTSGYSTEEAEYNAMKNQVVKYGGFYIGRFEAGINTATLRTGITSTAQEVVSKKGVAPYNYVKWGDSMTSIGTNGAVWISQNMYTGKTQATSVTSTLVYGIQWDAMCRYIGDYTRTRSWKNVTELTGSVSTDVSKNIYDLAGNCTEWTMEAYSTNVRVRRGGSHYSDNSPIANRGQDHVPYHQDNGWYLGFRCGLYIN